jgi:hypothetical protein
VANLCGLGVRGQKAAAIGSTKGVLRQVTPELKRQCLNQALTGQLILKLAGTFKLPLNFQVGLLRIPIGRHLHLARQRSEEFDARTLGNAHPRRSGMENLKTAISGLKEPCQYLDI